MQQPAVAEYKGTSKNFVKYELTKPYVGTIYVPKTLRPAPETIVVNLK